MAIPSSSMKYSSRLMAYDITFGVQLIRMDGMTRHTTTTQRAASSACSFCRVVWPCHQFSVPPDTPPLVLLGSDSDQASPVQGPQKRMRRIGLSSTRYYRESFRGAKRRCWPVSSHLPGKHFTQPFRCNGVVSDI